MPNMGLPGQGGPIGAGLAKFERFAQRAANSDGPAMRRMALELERAIKLQLSKPGTGKVRMHRLKRSKLSKTRKATKFTKAGRASAPGEPPAPDTGRLRNSITHGTIGGVMRVGTNVKYAPPLEFGTRTAGKSRKVVILPRPFMRPALESVKGRMTDFFVAELRAGSAMMGTVVP